MNVEAFLGFLTIPPYSLKEAHPIVLIQKITFSALETLVYTYFHTVGDFTSGLGPKSESGWTKNWKSVKGGMWGFWTRIFRMEKNEEFDAKNRTFLSVG